MALIFLLIYEASNDRHVARAVSDRNADEQAMERRTGKRRLVGNELFVPVFAKED
jgi:hypothetical protein